MKMRWPIVIGLAFVLAGSVRGVAQGPRMYEPKWTVGDMWTYSVQVQGQPAKITTTIVIGARDAEYSIRTILPDGRYEVSSSKGLAGVFAGITTVGNLGTPAWPLSVGQRWSETYLETRFNPPRPMKQDIIVDAYEQLTVPAGTFSAFRLALNVCVAMAEGECASVRVWLAPQAKNVTRVESGPEFWQFGRGLAVDLVAYAVVP